MPTTKRSPAGGPETTPHGLDGPGIAAGIDAILDRRPVVGLAAGIVRGGRLELFRGHGFADAEARTPITEDTVFRIASITKTFTAVAVLQLWERGLVDLDAPVNDHLRAFRLVPAHPRHRPATIRHLLTHTAGVPEVVRPLDVVRPDFGESVPAGRPMPSLAEYYRGGLRLHAEPGTRFVYGNHGFATLGQLVEDVSGLPLDRYLREHVFLPLGMADSDLLRSARVTSHLATGYRMRSGGPTPVAERDMVTAGAASIYSTPRDMARYVAALLGGGTNEHGTVLSPETAAAMFAPQYQPDPRLPGMGLGFFRADLGGHPAVEHQGVHPGFDSTIVLAPGDGVGVLAFTNGAKDAALWLPAEGTGLLRRVLGVPEPGIQIDAPQHPNAWGDLCGWYRLAAGPADVRLRGMLGAGTEVFVRRGRLHLRFLSPIPPLYRGFVLHPDDRADPYVFRIDMSEFGMGSTRVAFSRGPGPGRTTMHLELMPLSMRRQPAATNPRLWASGALAAVGVTTAAMIIRRLGPG